MQQHRRMLVLALAALSYGCGRYGYDLLSASQGGKQGDKQDDAGAFSPDASSADGTSDGHAGDGDGTGDSVEPADDGGLVTHDAGNGGDGNDMNARDGGTDAPDGSVGVGLSACPAPRNPFAPLPVNRYEFERTDTLAADSIGNRHGSLTGATQANGFAEVSGATTSYVQLPSGLISSLDAATIMLWVRWNSGPQNQTVLDFGQSENRRLQLLASTPGQGLTLRLRTASESLEVAGFRPLTIGVVQHVAIELDPARSFIALYLDGELEVTVENVDFRLSDIRDDNMWLGRPNGTEQPFQGGYQELRIYDRALGECAIARAREAGFQSTSFARCANPNDRCTYTSATTGASDFWLCTGSRTWAQAAERCAQAGMQLARIDTPGQNAAIAAVKGNNTVWLGLHDTGSEGTFVWCDEQAPSYTPWAYGEPNDQGDDEDCAVMVDVSAEWNDLNCDWTNGYVCQPP